MFEKMKDMGKMLKQAKDMKNQMQEVQSKLKNTVINSESPDQLVRVKITGELEIVELKINPELYEKGEVAAQECIQKTLNKAIAEAKQLATSQLADISKGFDIPGLTS